MVTLRWPKSDRVAFRENDALNQLIIPNFPGLNFSLLPHFFLLSPPPKLQICPFPDIFPIADLNITILLIWPQSFCRFDLQKFCRFDLHNSDLTPRIFADLTIRNFADLTFKIFADMHLQVWPTDFLQISGFTNISSPLHQNLKITSWF